MNGTALKARIPLNILMAVAVLFFPWWFVVIVALLLLIMYEAWEVLLWSIIFDMLYASPIPFYFNIPILFTFIFAVFFVAFSVFKRRLIFY